MTVDEILEYMLAFVPDNYDKSEGSFWNDLLKPVSVEMYLRQNEIKTLEENAFALTSSGEYLDRKAAEQGLTRRSGTYAKGTLKFTGVKGEVILAGAKAASEDMLYAVDETITIPDSGTVEVTATCTTAGEAGNAKVGTINRFPVTLRNVTAVENITEFTGGYDEENDFDLLERYIEKVSRPNTSGNKYHYISWAKEVTGVGNVSVVPLWNGPGTVKVTITDSENRPATDDLISEVAAHIEENRPIGASVTVTTPETVTINISVTLVGTPTDTDDIETAVDEYLTSIALEKQYVSIAKIGGLILDIDGVEDYSDLKLNGTSNNISIPDGYIPVLGEVTLNG